MIWYCWKNGSHIVASRKEGLLIRGVPESMIFVVEADSKSEASNKAAEIIKTIKNQYRERHPNL